MKYRKKPVVIEAVQVPDLSDRALFQQLCVDLLNLGANSTDSSRCFPETGHIRIETLEGDMRAFPGDWIIKGVKGEFYPCKPDIFAATYEPAEEGAGKHQRIFGECECGECAPR